MFVKKPEVEKCEMWTEKSSADWVPLILRNDKSRSKEEEWKISQSDFLLNGGKNKPQEGVHFGSFENIYRL